MVESITVSLCSLLFPLPLGEGRREGVSEQPLISHKVTLFKGTRTRTLSPTLSQREREQLCRK